MQFISFRVLASRIKAISSMMADKTVAKSKKILVILGIVYLFLPVDLIPPVLFAISAILYRRIQANFQLLTLLLRWYII